MKLSGGRRVVTMGAVLASMAFAGAVLGINATFAEITASQRHTHGTATALLAQRGAFVALVDEETGVRGYLASRSRLFLTSYQNGTRVYATFRTARPVDDPAVEPALRRFFVDGDAVEAQFHALLATAAAGHIDRAVAALPNAKTAFDRLRRDDAGASAALQASLDRDRVQISATTNVARLTSIGLVFVLALAGALSTALVFRSRANAALARRDPLTQLANRRAFEERLASTLAALEYDERLAVLYLDLDRFKPVNDTFGHAVGDEVLIICGTRLRNAVRPGDFIARIGGDEFGAILHPHGDAVAAQGIAGRIRSALEAPLTIAGKTIEIGASIGVATTPDDGIAAGELMHAADAAMFASKRARRHPLAS